MMAAIRSDQDWNGNQRPDPLCTGQCFYLYSSAPQPLRQYGRPTYRNNVRIPRDIGDYYNVMWDPRVRRGSGYKQPEKNFIECFNVRKPRAVIRKPKFVYVRAPTPPRPRRDNYENRTINHMEELNPHLIEDENIIVDVEATLELPTCPSIKIPYPGISVATEIGPGELFDFEGLAKPVCEALVGQTVERSIFELLEEEELDALRVQHTKFLALRLKEQKKLLELRKQNDCFQAERKRVAAEANEYIRVQEEVTHRIEAISFSCLYLGGQLRDVREGLTMMMPLSQIQSLISNYFNPWVNAYVQDEVRQQTLCRNLMDNLLLSVVKQREVSFFIGKWKQVQDEMKHVPTEIPAPTPTAIDESYSDQ